VLKNSVTVPKQSFLQTLPYYRNRSNSHPQITKIKPTLIDIFSRELHLSTNIYSQSFADVTSVFLPLCQKTKTVDLFFSVAYLQV